MFEDLGAAMAFVLAAIALSSTIGRGLSGRLRRLLAVMERLTAGDADLEVPHLTDVNETGRIARTLAAFKESVIERSKLKSDKALQDELDAERAANEQLKEENRRIQAEAISRLADALSRLARAI